MVTHSCDVNRLQFTVAEFTQSLQSNGDITPSGNDGQFCLCTHPQIKQKKKKKLSGIEAQV